MKSSNCFKAIHPFLMSTQPISSRRVVVWMKKSVEQEVIAPEEEPMALIVRIKNFQIRIVCLLMRMGPWEEMMDLLEGVMGH